MTLVVLNRPSSGIVRRLILATFRRHALQLTAEQQGGNKRNQTQKNVDLIIAVITADGFIPGRKTQVRMLPEMYTQNGHFSLFIVIHWRCIGMNWHSIALISAGVIGGGTAVIHGILMQRMIIRRIEEVFAEDGRIAAPMQRLVALLLHFTTLNWLLSGLTLIAAAIWFKEDTRLAMCLLAGSSFLYGAIVSLWVIRRPHPSWILMAVTLVLIVLGLTPL